MSRLLQAYRPQTPLYAGLATGVFSVSLAAIFIRLAQEAPPLTIASYRLGAGAILMAAFVAASRVRNGGAPLEGFRRADVPLVGFSSLCLGTHFWVWTVSLEHTSVASSVVLVTTNPFIVAIASRVLWGEPLRRRTMGGIAVGVAGGAILALGDSGRAGGELFGDTMAFLGAIAVVGYVLSGRRLRGHMPAATYNVTVYSGTAVLLVTSALVTGASFVGYSAGTYLWLLVLALVPQAIGHSLLNWSLGYVTATAVAISVMAEPVIATAVAVPVLGEAPPLTSVAGGILILAGIYVAMRPQRGSPVAEAESS